MAKSMRDKTNHNAKSDTQKQTVKIKESSTYVNISRPRWTYFHKNGRGDEGKDLAHDPSCMSPYQHPDDRNLQIYPTDGPDRVERALLDFFSPEPQAADNKKRLFAIKLIKTSSRKAKLVNPETYAIQYLTLTSWPSYKKNQRAAENEC